MIQDIEPSIYNNSFFKDSPKDDDYILMFNGSNLYLKSYIENYSIPRYKDIKDVWSGSINEVIYLFSIDDNKFFLDLDSHISGDILTKVSIQAIRTVTPKWAAFAGETAYHLYNWYDLNRYCGRCASKMMHSSTERALVCSCCNNIKYPRISPGIIVGIINKDKILLTKYAGRAHKNYALVAGFNEIGETLEDTVRREVMEEVGLKVKNIRYYKNQPWGFTSSLLVGFFAELDGDDKITLQEEELSEALWVGRDEIDASESSISMTQDMIDYFAEGYI